ncbi:Ca2+-binding RTX toxin-like protein [Pseudomonas sp. JUb42]|uniref:hypothetical protein n=1 Tax=Pseudomonas sp. JUb42 TaxID=2940611 RepID=UPI002167C96B|nr:hypothetical protein [Pseudomonas sp. JUb42]MCS3472600.1 Ca2+-binding RTX toxin-like protein [Pseudomonas sp. JUb42]
MSLKDLAFGRQDIRRKLHDDVLPLTTSAVTTTSLTSLSGFETVHLAGSSAVITIANDVGTAAVSVQLGTGGQKFVGRAGADTISGGTGADTLTGGAGIDTFNLGNRSTPAFTDTITDYRAGGAGNDIITISDITTVASNINLVQTCLPKLACWLRSTSSRMTIRPTQA